MTKRVLSMVMAVLMMFSAVSPAYATGNQEEQQAQCTHSTQCLAQEHSGDCCIPIGCGQTHLKGCLRHIPDTGCSLCTGTVDKHSADCISLCSGKADCGAVTHRDTCMAKSASGDSGKEDPQKKTTESSPEGGASEVTEQKDAYVHAQGCKYPQQEHDTCKTVCDTGCTLEASHAGDCLVSQLCAAEGCEYVSGHEGLHSNETRCEAEGCEYVSGHEGLHSNETRCEAEGCEYVSGHEGLHSNEIRCDTEGCEFAKDHDGSCSNAVPTLSEVGLAALTLLQALPGADALPPQLTPEQWQEQMAAVEEALNAFNGLGPEDTELMESQYPELVLNALALNDALLEVEPATYAHIAYNSSSKSNVTITLTDQFDYAATGVALTVTRGNDTYEVVELGGGRYGFTKNETGHSDIYTITVAGPEGEFAQEQIGTLRGNSSSASLTVEVLGEYWLDLRLYYYIEEDFFPGTFGGYGAPVHYGPSQNDTPFIILPVDVNKLRQIAETNDAVVFRPSPDNNNQWEFTPKGGTSPKNTALENTKLFWAQILACMSADSRTALGRTGVGDKFYGYSLKKQNNNSLHIDGVLDAVLPVYIIELYQNNSFFQQFYADGATANADFKSMDDVLAAFRARLGQTNNPTFQWTAGANDTYTGTYVANSMRYTVSVTRINSNKGQGSVTKNRVMYYSQSSDNSYYLAKFNVTLSQETPLYTVTYQWKVYGPDGEAAVLPEGTFQVPDPVSNLEPGTDFAYNTGFDSNTSYPDYENGLLYTFSGWNNYALTSNYSPEPDATHPAITGPTVPVNGNTWINGVWRATPLEPADAHILLKKNVVVESGGDETYVRNYLQNTGRFFIQVETHADKEADGKTHIDADYGQVILAEGHRVDVYQYEDAFTFTEKNAEIPGYTLTRSAAVTGPYSHFVDPDAPFDENGVLSVDMDVPQNGEELLGTVTITNTYTKQTGAAVDDYPSLSLYKYAGDTSDPLEGIRFTLTRAEDADDVRTATTNSKGLLQFDRIPAGTWHLKELNVPNGYRLCQHHGEQGFTVVVAPAAQSVEELRENVYVQVNYHTLTVVQDGICNHIYTAVPMTEEAIESNHYYLNVENEPIMGRLTFKKGFEGAQEADYADVFMRLHLHGPITRDAQKQITGLGTSRVVELKAGDSWTKTLVNLPLGEYLVHEPIYDVHGYTWLGATYNGAEPAVVYNGETYYLVDIQRNTDSDSDREITLDVVNHYEAWTDATLVVNKRASGLGGGPLEGAQFTLYSDETLRTQIAQYTTGSEGTVRFGGLSVPEEDTDGVGVYYLKETRAPNGYYLSQQVWKVEVKLVGTRYETKVSTFNGEKWVQSNGFSQQDDLLTVYNTPVLGSLNITKQFVGTMPETLTQIQVQVRSESGIDHGTYVLDRNSGWSTTVEELPMGKYTVTETQYSAPGYDLIQSASVTSVQVTLSDTTGTIISAANAPVENAVLKNAYERNERVAQTYASFQVKKVDSVTGQPLKDAAFALYRGTDTQGSPVATLYTNDQGLATFSNLHGSLAASGDPQDGIYTLVETAAPEGYEKVSQKWRVTVKEDDGEYRVVLNQSDNLFENIWDWIIGAITGQSLGEEKVPVLTVENTPVRYTLTVTKKFTEDDSALTPPDGAAVELLVTGPGGYSRKLVLDGTVDSVETAAWTATLPELELGEYTVRETFAALHGHSWQKTHLAVNADAITKTISTGQEAQAFVTFTTSDRAANGKLQVTSGETVAVTVTNDYRVWDEVGFHIQKVDADDNTILLENAVFQLYAEDGVTKLENQSFTTRAVTDERGLADFTGFTVPEGADSVTYILKEETAAPGYSGCADSWPVTISKDNGAYSLTIDDTGSANGTFYAANDRLVVVNSHIPVSLQIRKVISGVAEGHMTGAEATFLVTGPHNFRRTVTLDGIVDTGEAALENEAWSVTLTGLRMGQYTVEETGHTVPGYRLAGTTYQVGAGNPGREPAVLELNSQGETKQVTVTNAYEINEHTLENPASFEILKVDATDETKKLEGAVFGLFAGAAQEPVFKAATDADGIARFQGLVGDQEDPDGIVTYTLKEITAPTGYLKTKDTWTVTVTEKDGRAEVTLHAEDNHYDTVWDWIVNVLKPREEENQLIGGRLTVKNTPTKLTLTKQEVWYLDGAASTLAQIKGLFGPLEERTYSFQIHWQVDGKNYSANREIRVTDGTGGTATVEGIIPEGAAYRVQEVTQGERDFAVSYGVGCEGTIGPDSAAAVTNSYYFNRVDPLNEDDELTDRDSETLRVQLKLTKLDPAADRALQGAKFELRTGSGSRIAEATSDASGHLSFDITTAGTYYLVETQAPAGYSRLNSAFPIRVANGEPYTTRETIDDVTVTVTHIPLEITGAGDLTLENGRYVVNNLPTMDLTVNKVWDDDNYYKRPDKVQVKLLLDGVEAQGYDPITLSKANDWTGGWTGLDAGRNWTVAETALGDGYTASYSELTDGKITITNTREPELVDISVKKVWKGTALSEVTVRLYGDGVLLDSVRLNSANSWSHTWKDLPDSRRYSVDEAYTAGYYKRVTHDDDERNWVVTNTQSLIPKTGDNVELALGTMVASAGALIVLLLLGRKRRRQGRYQ